MAKGAKLPVETIARRPRFVAEAQPVVSGGKLVGQFVHRIRLVADLSPVADLAPPTILGQTHGNLAFANIQTNVNCCILLHGSSPMPETLPGLPANPHSDCETGYPPPLRGGKLYPSLGRLAGGGRFQVGCRYSSGILKRRGGRMSGA